MSVISKDLHALNVACAKLFITVAIVVVGIAAFCQRASADEIDEATAYKALMQQQMLSHQQAAQQQLMTHTIETFQAEKIAHLKAQLAVAQQPQQQPVYRYLPAPQAYVSPNTYRGQPYNVAPQLTVPAQQEKPAASDNHTVLPVTVPESLSKGEEELTPDEASQEQKEQQEAKPAAPTYSDGDPLGLKPTVYYVNRPGYTPLRVMYRYRAAQPARTVYTQPHVLYAPAQYHTVAYR
jgi:hypothetical protein